MLHTLHSLDDVRHQYQWFARMRATEPVWLDETSGCWHVFGYEEVKTVLTDYAQFSSQRNRRMAFRRTLVGNSLIAMDPPRHRQYRNLVSPFFTPKALARLSGRITEIVQELLDQVRPQGTMDVIAGHVTTTNLIGNALLCFDAHPDVLAQLRQRPDLMPSAIEEVLRYASPVWRMTRVTTSEVMVAGTRIPAEAVIFAWIASANRDETQFPAADRFEVERTPNRHVAFGHGIHFCIGAPLARLEAALALPMMLEQLSDLRRDRTVASEPLESRILFGVKSLPLAFTPSIPQQVSVG